MTSLLFLCNDSENEYGNAILKEAKNHATLMLLRAYRHWEAYRGAPFSINLISMGKKINSLQNTQEGIVVNNRPRVKLAKNVLNLSANPFFRNDLNRI